VSGENFMSAIQATEEHPDDCAMKEMKSEKPI
jgi:hypothetical protein